MIETTCDCGARVEGDDVAAMGDAFIAHVRADHADWPYPDEAVRNYAEAKLRLTGPTERLDEIGAVEVHRVTEDRIDDWLAFFDHDGFADNPAWASCYCLEPHVYDPSVPPEQAEHRHWSQSRSTMEGLLRSGGSFGYLAYVDGRAAGWVNASKRADYSLYRQGDAEDDDTVGISCFVIAPPYRRHGIAAKLLERVLADAPGRGVRWVEAYPFSPQGEGDAANFRGPRAMYEENGFEAVDERERYVVMRKQVGQ